MEHHPEKYIPLDDSTKNSKTMSLPLQFWFSQNWGLALPIYDCYMFPQVKIELEFLENRVNTSARIDNIYLDLNSNTSNVSVPTRE